MVEKIYRCKVWTPAYIHFKADSVKQALNLTTRFFFDREEYEVESVEEVVEGTVDEDIVFHEKSVPNITIN